MHVSLISPVRVLSGPTMQLAPGSEPYFPGDGSRKKRRPSLICAGMKYERGALWRMFAFEKFVFDVSRVAGGKGCFRGVYWLFSGGSGVIDTAGDGNLFEER